MITYVAEDGKIAVPSSVSDVKTTFSVHSSWEQFVFGQPPLSVHEFNGVYNYPAIDAFFAGWTKQCRDDSNWAVTECGETPAPVVPQSVSARQIRLWLISNSITLAQIETLIDNIESQHLRDYTRVEWEYAPYIERNHPMVATFATALGLTEEQIDQGFILASTL